MPANTGGFGLGEVDLAAQAQHISDLLLKAKLGDHTALLQLIEAHLSKLQDKYVESPYFAPQIIQVPFVGSGSSPTVKFDLSDTPHNSLIMFGFAGSAGLLFGDYVGSNPAIATHSTISAGSTIQLFFPLQSRVYTLVNPSTTTQATVSLTAMAI